MAGMWDRLANRLVSSRRKDPEAIHFLEHAGASEKLPRLSLEDDMMRGGGAAVLDLVSDLAPSRRVWGGPLDDRLLAWLLEFLRQAPTADNSQIWRLVFMRDPERIRTVLEGACRGREDLVGLLDSHPGALIVAAATKFFIPHRTHEQPFFLIDVPIGLLHVLLAVRHFGLAFNVVWDFDHRTVAGRTGLDDHEVVALVLLGRQGEAADAEPWVQLRPGRAA